MAAGATYTSIASQTLSSAASSVTFSSISGAYTDLVLIATPIVTTAAANTRCQINGDTSTTYSETFLRGDGSAVVSYRDSSINGFYISDTGRTTSSKDIQIVNFMNYSNATTYKTMVYREGASDSSTGMGVALWRSTSAITSFVIYPTAGNFNTGSTFSLYGIAAA